MNARELIHNWPQWRNAGSQVILESPALAVHVEYGGQQMVLHPASAVLADTIDLKLRFDEETFVLSLGDSSLFPDLHILWKQRLELPPQLLLALVEKECGELLQTLESLAAGRRLSVIGLSDPSEPRPAQKAFQMGDLHFSLQMPDCLTLVMGDVSNLEPTHESIRSMTRSARPEYAVISLEEQEIASLTEGDCLLLEDECGKSGKWIDDLPSDTSLHLCNAEQGEISFAQYADDQLPPVPSPNELLLFFKGQPFAEGALDSVGERLCFRLTRLL